MQNKSIANLGEVLIYQRAAAAKAAASRTHVSHVAAARYVSLHRRSLAVESCESFGESNVAMW